MAKKKTSGCLSIFTLLAAASVILVLGLHILGNATPQSRGDNEVSDSDTYLRASSNLWEGVKLYYGEGVDKEYVFEVLGGNDNYIMANGGKIRGVLVKYPDGSIEWKNRDYIIQGNKYWIKSSDPALVLKSWKIIDH